MKTMFLLSALILAASLVVVSPVHAQETDVQPHQSTWAWILPWRWHHAEATPGHLVTLSGRGVVRAKGEGVANYRVKDGVVRVDGGGVVAVKGGQVRATGYSYHGEYGGWKWYVGHGKLQVKGTDFRVVSWGEFGSSGKGSGQVTFRGRWQIRYRGFGQVATHLPTDATAPVELENQVSEFESLE